MGNELKCALKNAIEKSWGVVVEELDKKVKRCLIWEKQPSGGWRGRYYDIPDLQKAINRTRDPLDEAATDFARLFAATYPAYSGPIGLEYLKPDQITTHVKRIPESAMRWLWYAQWPPYVDDCSVDALVNDFLDSVDRSTIRLRFQGQLLNYQMDSDRLALPNSLVIRRLSESEVTRFNGGSVEILGFLRPQFGGPHEFVIEGEIEVEKETRNLESLVHAKAKRDFDKAVFCLRTFKEGHVGYDYVHISPVTFYQCAFFSRGSGSLYVPFGGYRILREEEGQLTDYAELFFQASEPSLEMACSRLADAETRTRPQDRLVDSVVGMEAILLSGLRSEDRRGELRYRFSIHYSTLFDTPEARFRAFRVAKDLYDVRSAIAHGTNLMGKSVRVGDEKIDLETAAKRATDALRGVVRRFLPEAKSPRYKKPGFWERAFFGLCDDSNE